MMDANTFWTLPRRLTPTRVIAEVLPELPDIFPVLTIARPTNLHISGSGGGVWALHLVDGRLRAEVGPAANALCQVACARSAFAALVGGALRDRGLEVMRRMGRAGELPDLRALPVDPAHLEAVSRLQGSVAIEVEDRPMREVHRFVITFGSGLTGLERATTTVRFDVDDWVGWTVERRPPIGVLRGGRVRVAGDLSLPVQALQALLGAAAEHGGPHG